jgi:hypothetical protein
MEINNDSVAAEEGNANMTLGTGDVAVDGTPTSAAEVEAIGGQIADEFEIRDASEEDEPDAQSALERFGVKADFFGKRAPSDKAV